MYIYLITLSAFGGLIQDNFRPVTLPNGVHVKCL